VKKSVVEGRTRTIVEPITGEARVTELAQMLGGETEGTREIARELLSQRAP
jgi:DNA repair ATPase RecN